MCLSIFLRIIYASYCEPEASRTAPYLLIVSAEMWLNSTKEFGGADRVNIGRFVTKTRLIVAQARNNAARETGGTKPVLSTTPRLRVPLLMMPS